MIYQNKIVLSRQIVLECNLSADDWELFHDPGREDAAAELNTAVIEATKLYDEEAQASDEIHKVQWKLREYGAADSEANHLVDRILQEVYGN